MDFKKAVVRAAFAAVFLAVGGCAVDQGDHADVEVVLDKASIQADGTSFVVSGLTDGVPNRVQVSKVTFEDAPLSTGGLKTNQIKIRCYFCVCRDTECRCTEIQCPE